MSLDSAPRHVTHDGPLGGACPACAAIGVDWTPWRELANPAARQAGVEAVVDHLGFCSRHLAWLSADLCPAGLDELLTEAYAALAAILGDRARCEERLLEIMFRSRCSCAACTLERRRIAIAAPARAAERLCLVHYLAAVGKADEAELSRLATAACGGATALLERLDGESGDDGPVLEAAFLWLTGSAPGTANALTATRSPSPAPACTVCRAARGAADRWLVALGRAAQIGIGLRALLPLCPTHIGMCLDRAALPARDLARQLIGAVGAALDEGLVANERAERREREAAESVFHRPRSAAYVLGRRRRALRLPRCAACERVELACERTQGAILDRLADRRGRTALETGGELCIRHFAEVYVLAPHGKTRADLAESQRRALERARNTLKLGHDPGAWRRAIQQLGGVDG